MRNVWKWYKENVNAIVGLCIVIGLLGGLAKLSVIDPIHQRFDDTNQRIDDLIAVVNQRFDAVDQRFDAQDKVINQRFDDQDKAIDQRFDAVDQRFEAVDQRFDDQNKAVNQRFDAVDQRFDDQNKAVNQRFDAVDQRFRRPGQARRGPRQRRGGHPPAQRPRLAHRRTDRPHHAATANRRRPGALTARPPDVLRRSIFRSICLATGCPRPSPPRRWWA